MFSSWSEYKTQVLKIKRNCRRIKPLTAVPDLTVKSAEIFSPCRNSVFLTVTVVKTACGFIHAVGADEV